MTQRWTVALSLGPWGDWGAVIAGLFRAQPVWEGGGLLSDLNRGSLCGLW